MHRGLRRWIHVALKVPRDPDPPAGSRDVRVFRAAPNYYKYKVFLWLIAQIGALLGLSVGLFFASRFAGAPDNLVGWIFRLGEIAAWVLYLVQLPFSYVLLRLDFEMRWYILSDRSLRIREGTVFLKEKTMTFANVQQIAVHENPLQRILGIADLQVRSAGGGGSQPESGSGQIGESMHEAWFRGVSNAEEIRDVIRQRVQQHRDAGLGDPDEAVLPPERSISEVLRAVRELRQETVLLRGTPRPATPSRT